MVIKFKLNRTLFFRYYLQPVSADCSQLHGFGERETIGQEHGVSKLAGKPSCVT